MCPTQELTVRALAETRAIDVLEEQFAAELDFGGIQTTQVRLLCFRKSY
jgi:hypothetical protein